MTTHRKKMLLATSLLDFVKPERTQECLLGINPSIPLGFKSTDRKRKPLRTDPVPDPNPSVAQVSLIKGATIPSQKSCLLKAKVTGEHSFPGKYFMFETKHALLQPLGLCTSDSLVSMCDGRTVFIPFTISVIISVHIPDDTEFGGSFSESPSSDSVQHATCALKCLSTVQAIMRRITLTG